MSPITSFRENSGRVYRTDEGVLRDHHQRLEDEARERAERKRLQLAEQRSDMNDPGARVRAWEKFHELRLPKSPTHPVLLVIAAATGLTLEDVQQEQRARNASVR